MNALVDPEIIRALYAASRAGVAIDLVVRGICCLRPGVPGVSERIRVTSIVGRFLEHSRAWMFENDGEPECYLGSSDWMPRNFDRRVEAVVPIEDPTLHVRMRRLLETSLADNRQGWDLHSDGSYEKRVASGADEISAHATFMADSWGLPLGEAPRPSRRVEILQRTARSEGVSEATL